MNYRKFLIAALLVMSFAVQAKDITVTRLTCEMRESDWSSDVCSSDLAAPPCAVSFPI